MSDAVEIAAITALFATIGTFIATLPALISSIRNRGHMERLQETSTRLQETIGETNGNGDVATMQARALGELAELHAGVAELRTYSHDRAHRLANQMTVLIGAVQMIWDKVFPGEPSPFSDVEPPYEQDPPPSGRQ